MTADLADSLVPLAAELVGTVRDFGPDDVAAVLARVPDGRHDALAVVLAAMVDPDQTARDLLAWINNDPPKRSRYPREHGSLRGYRQHSYRNPYDPPCAACRAAHAADRASRRTDKKVALHVVKETSTGAQEMGGEWRRIQGVDISRPPVVSGAGNTTTGGLASRRRAD